MPIVVNPGYVWPPEVDPVVSPDGRLTAIVDPAHAGVLLRADFDDSVPDTPAQPEKVLRRNRATNPALRESAEYWAHYMPGPTVTATRVADGKVGGYCYRLTTGSEAATSTGGIYYRDTSVNSPGGAVVSAGVWVKQNSGVDLRVSLAARKGSATVGSASSGHYTASGDWQWVTCENMVIESAYDYVQIWVTVRTAQPAGFEQSLDGAMIIEGASAPTSFFDGETPTSGKKRYRYASDGSSEEYNPATPFIPGHDATTARVRFERQDNTLVRSGNPAWAPGGYAHAYDHEATLGGGTLWRAVPILFDGTEGTPSEYVGAVIPGLSDGWAWLKPVSEPDKAMLLKVEPPDLSYDGRVDTTSIAGSARPAATWDVLEGFTTQLRSLVREKPVADQLMALLDEGPVLAQFPACAGLPDFYFIRGKVDLEHVHWDGYPWRRYQWDVISIDRPDTTDSPLRIPDLSYDTVERDWTTYDQLKSTVVSYNKLLEP